MVTALSERTKTPIGDLVQTFGTFLFGSFVKTYPHALTGAENTFEFLEHVEEYIHLEVQKLYPDAELPRFVCTHDGPDRFTLQYISTRPFARLCYGLIEGCIQHFNERISIEMQDAAADGSTLFVLTRSAS